MKPKPVLALIATVLLSCLTCANLLKAEMFIGPTSTTNRFLIQTNESILISSIASSSYDFLFGLVVSGVTYAAGLDTYRISDIGSPYAISGPAELLITNPCAIKITRLTNAPITTILFPANDTNAITVSVPEGKTIVFFPALWPYNSGSDPLGATISNGKQGSQPFRAAVCTRQAFEGPISFQLLPTENGGAKPTPVACVSYWFTEDVFQFPTSLVARLPGAPRIIVEHSTDLATWEWV